MTVPDMTCDYCGQPTDVVVTYQDGVTICLPCKAKEQARVAAAFRDVYGPEYDLLAVWQHEGR